MTPAVKLLQKLGIEFKLHQYDHDPACESYGQEAAEQMGVDQSRIFKTLVVELDRGDLAVGIIPVSNQLNMKNLAKALGAKKASMAAVEKVERSTGYVLGGVSPIGQKKRLVTILDNSAENLSAIFISAGRRGLEIEINPANLADLIKARFAKISQTTQSSMGKIIA